MDKTSSGCHHRLNIAKFLRDWCAYLILQYELITCVGMFEPWERLFINGLFLTLFTLVTYSSVVYLPKYLISLVMFFEPTTTTTAAAAQDLPISS